MSGQSSSAGSVRTANRSGARAEEDKPRNLTAKTLEILESFSADHPRLTVTEISRKADLPLSTTHRIVRELQSLRALERSGDGRYHIGLRMWEIGSLAPRGVPLRELALPYMEDLYEATHENVQLAVREGMEVVYLERLAGRGAVPVLTRVGGRFALHSTGVGLVLLAHAPTEVQERVLASPLRQWTPATITDPATLRAKLAEVRSSGVAISNRQVTYDAVSVACPIFGRDESVVAALSVVVHIDHGDYHALVPAVRAASRSISRALGSARASRRAAGRLR